MDYFAVRNDICADLASGAGLCRKIAGNQQDAGSRQGLSALTQPELKRLFPTTEWRLAVGMWGEICLRCGSGRDLILDLAPARDTVSSRLLG